MQCRGVERRQAILDAAEELLDQQGYEAATVKAMGERAGIPTASLYHYVADRYQVEVELLQRYLQSLDDRINDALTSPALRTLQDAIDGIIDPMLAYFRANPSCAELWFVGRHQSLTELVQASDEAWAERLWRLLVKRKLVTADTPLLAVQLAFVAGSGLFDVAFRSSPKGDEAIKTKARRLVIAYLETYAPKRRR